MRKEEGGRLASSANERPFIGRRRQSFLHQGGEGVPTHPLLEEAVGQCHPNMVSSLYGHATHHEEDPAPLKANVVGGKAEQSEGIRRGGQGPRPSVRRTNQHCNRAIQEEEQASMTRESGTVRTRPGRAWAATRKLSGASRVGHWGKRPSSK